MNKKRIFIIIFTLIDLAIFVFLVVWAVIKEEGLFSSHWWYLGDLIAHAIATLIFFLAFWIRRSKESKKQLKPEQEEKKGMGYYQEMVNNYWKKKLDDMYMLDRTFAVPFPSIDQPKLVIVKGIGYNLRKTVFFAVGNKKVEYALDCSDIEEFKKQLKPSLLETSERIEEDILTGRTSKLIHTRPIEEQLKEKEEKEKEEERIETMEAPKKEEK